MSTANSVQFATYTSHILNDIDLSSSVDIREKVSGFWQEMRTLLKDYSRLSNNPMPSETMMIGSTMVNGAQINLPSTALLLDTRMSEIENAQSMLLQIWHETFNMEKSVNSSFSA